MASFVKKIVRSVFFPHKDKQKILTGPSKGMFIRYDVNHRSQHLLGLYEREIYSYLEKGMRKARVLIDVGANDGYYVMGFLKTGKKVIACEPGDISGEIIANARLNNFNESDNFILEKRLVGSGPSPSFVGIEALTEKHTGPFFFLVDIDGGEFELLQSCGKNFDFKKSSWLIETHSKELEDNCIDFLQKKNYKVTVIKNGWWRAIISEQRPIPHNRWLFAEPLV